MTSFVSEEMPALRHGWPTSELNEIAQIVSGITLGKRGVKAPVRLVPYLRVANVKDGHLDLSEVKRIEATEAEIETLRLERGDVLLTEGGDADKLGRGTFWNGQLAECIHQNHIFRVRFREDAVDPAFAAFQFGSLHGKQYFAAHAKQTTGIASINRGILMRFPFLCPPLGEQRRLASELNRKMEEVARARTAAMAQLSSLQMFRAALVREAFFGDGPRGWPIATLGEVLAETRNGLYKHEDSYGRGERILKMFNIGRLDGAWVLDRIDRVEISAAEFRGFSLRAGDILLNRVNSRELVGKCAVVDSTTAGAVFESKNIRLRVNTDRVSPGFISLWLNTAAGRSAIADRTRQIAGMATLNKGDISSLIIPVPPLAEQQRIAGRLSEQFAEIERARAAAEIQLTTVAALPVAYLRQAFSANV